MSKRLRSPSQEHGTEQQKNLKKLYFCTCERYCHGGKEVSKRTLASHANYRDKQDYSSGASSVSENSSESDSDTSGSSESGSHSYESDSNNSETHIPPNKKARLREPDSFAFEDDDFTTVVRPPIFSSILMPILYFPARMIISAMPIVAEYRLRTLILSASTPAVLLMTVSRIQSTFLKIRIVRSMRTTWACRMMWRI